ncbi:MAG TPA: vWA domain-containing protein [Candidatus Competibacter denitrificans]|nr:vWA domain-containing protein [Candidatus Competibacter denitrificans]
MMRPTHKRAPQSLISSWPCLRRLCGLWLYLWLGCLLVAPCQARVVGLVFDDSGSMSSIFERADFAAQLLVAALNEGDQLYVVRLNGDNAQVNGPITLANRQSFIDQIRQWQKTNSGTPYEPLDGMLAKLVAVTPPNEEASLLVITDGGFDSDAARTPGALGQRYLQLKSAFKGKNLAAHFVLLSDGTIDQQIEQQGIRPKLLEIFNGNSQIGRVEVDRNKDIFPALRDVITQLYGTDANRSQAVVDLQGSRIRLKPPFSINRLVIAIADERGGALPRFQSANFALKQTPPSLLQPTIGNYKANVYHLQPTQALLPGATYELNFDRALPPETQVLFDSGLDLQLSFFSNGQPLKPDSRGRLVVTRNTPLEVRATLIDRLNPKVQQVDFSALPQDPVFTLSPQGQQNRAMTLNKPQNHASAQVTYTQPGLYGLAVEARYPGFVIVRAQDVRIEVQTVQPIQLSLKAERRDGCTNCKPDEAHATFTTQPGQRDLFAIAIQADRAPEAAPYRLELVDPLPAGVRLLLPDGRSALSGGNRVTDTLTLQPGQKVTALLQYDATYRDRTPHTPRLRLTPTRPDWQGKADLSLTLQPQAPQLAFREAGHTGTDPNQPFQLPVTELGHNQGAFFVAEQALRELDLGLLTLSSPTLNMRAMLEGPDRLRIVPGKNWWCDCLTAAGDHAYTLDYRDPKTGQSARFSGKITLQDVPWWEKCWQEILLLLLVLLTLLKIICLLRTDRFPASSRLIVTQNKQIVKRIRLHSFWSTLLSCRNERRRTIGLELHATPNGANIAFNSKIPPTLYYEATGERLTEIFENAPQRPAPWHWGDTLKDDQSRMIYELKKTP